MLTTAALVLALGLGADPSSSLKLANLRLTHGILGPTRTDNRILPGDSFCLSYDIQGVRADEQGQIRYSIEMVVTDSAGKMIYRQEPREMQAVNALGGNSLPAYVRLDVGGAQKPGMYRVKVTVTDLVAKASSSLNTEVELLAPRFGLVQLRTTGDLQGQVLAPSVGVAGQSIFVNLAAVGFARDPQTKQPHLVVALQVLDEQNKPTIAKPFVGEVKEDVSEKAMLAPLQFLLPLNRPGQFTVTVVAVDKVSNQKAELLFPYTVVQAR